MAPAHSNLLIILTIEEPRHFKVATACVGVVIILAASLTARKLRHPLEQRTADNLGLLGSSRYRRLDNERRRFCRHGAVEHQFVLAGNVVERRGREARRSGCRRRCCFGFGRDKMLSRRQIVFRREIEPSKPVCNVRRLALRRRGVTGAVADGRAATPTCVSPSRKAGSWAGPHCSMSMPVATTETRILPLRFSLKAEPPDDVRIGIDQLTDMVRGFVDFHEAHVLTANDRDDDTLGAAHRDAIEQRIGDRFSAAASARPSPSASPVPIIALPISPITERTSAKSRLMRPGMTMRSVMPRSPAAVLRPAISNASLKVVFGLAIRNRSLVRDDDQHVDMLL